MTVNIVLMICLVALTAGLLAVIAYVLMILSNVRKMLKPVDKMLNELGSEFRPLLNDMSGITSSVSNIAGRADRVTRFFFGKVELMSQGAETAAGYAQKFMKNPKGEIDSIMAGVKKGLQILFKKKGGE